MKKHFVLAPLALAVVAAFSFVAVAEEAKPAAPAAPAAAAPAAKPAAPRVEVKATVTGKLSTKKVKNKKGEEVDGLFVSVATAKAADGKDLTELKGKELRVGGKKELNLKSYVGKDVTLDGTLVNGKHLRVESVK